MKRIMGIDYGTARIGVALSDELQMLAHPAETIVVAKTSDPAGRIAALAREKDVARIVVGLPRHMNGSAGTSARGSEQLCRKKSERWCRAKSGPGTSGSQPWPRIAHCVKRENRLEKREAMLTRWRRRCSCKVISTVWNTIRAAPRRILLPRESTAPVPHRSRRLKLIVAYDGSGFSGWQSQARGDTIQDRIEAAFANVLGQKLRVHGAGRTDAGVHALGQCAHVDLPPTRLEPSVLTSAINASLPPQIRILRCWIRHADFSRSLFLPWKSLPLPACDYASAFAVRVWSCLACDGKPRRPSPARLRSIIYREA